MNIYVLSNVTVSAPGIAGAPADISTYRDDVTLFLRVRGVAASGLHINLETSADTFTTVQVIKTFDLSKGTVAEDTISARRYEFPFSSFGVLAGKLRVNVTNIGAPCVLDCWLEV
jgi:hypothetical protein